MSARSSFARSLVALLVALSGSAVAASRTS